MEPYYSENLTNYFDDPTFVKLQELIDPYTYRQRLTMPKMVVSLRSTLFLNIRQSSWSSFLINFWPRNQCNWGRVFCTRWFLRMVWWTRKVWAYIFASTSKRRTHICYPGQSRTKSFWPYRYAQYSGISFGRAQAVQGKKRIIKS